MRLHELAKQFGVTHSVLIDALRQQGLGARFGSPMTHVLDEDVPAIVAACLKQKLPITVSHTQQDSAKAFMADERAVKERADNAMLGGRSLRSASREANLGPLAPSTRAPRASWPDFLEVIASLEQSSTPYSRVESSEGYATGQGELRVLADPLAWRQMLSHRRQAVSALYESYGAFDEDVVVDLFLLDASDSLQRGLFGGDMSLVSRLQKHYDTMFPARIDWDYLDRNAPHGSPSIKRNLEFVQLEHMLRFDFDLAEQVGKYSNIEAFSIEQQEELEDRIRGDLSMDYERLKAIYEDEQLATQSALVHELLISDDQLVEMVGEHLGAHEKITLIDLFGGDENSRYDFHIAASPRNAVSFVTARQL